MSLLACCMAASRNPAPLPRRAVGLVPVVAVVLLEGEFPSASLTLFGTRLKAAWPTLFSAFSIS